MTVKPDHLLHTKTHEDPPEDYITAKVAAMSSMTDNNQLKAALMRLPSPFCPARCCYNPGCLEYPRPAPCPPKWARRFIPTRLVSLMDLKRAVQHLLTAPVKPQAIANTVAYMESLDQLIKELIQMSVPFTNVAMYRPALEFEVSRRKEARRRTNIIRKIVHNNRKFLRLVYELERTPRLQPLPYKEHPIFQCAATSTILKVAQDNEKTFRVVQKNEKVYTVTETTADAMFDF